MIYIERTDTLNNLNPYRSPSYVDVAVPLNTDASTKPVHSWLLLRVTLFLIVAAAHVYFLALLTSWTWHWVSGSMIFAEPFGYGLIACAVVCAVSSAVVLWGIVRRRSAIALVSTVVCTISYVAIWALVFFSLK